VSVAERVAHDPRVPQVVLATAHPAKFPEAVERACGERPALPAHLADLMDEQGQSLILTFAAYNAGGKRVKEWIAAYGDPRKPDVDPIDWVERIPFTETRNYVQRVVENLGIYRARLSAGDKSPPIVDKDLRAREARL